jgi:hypothetical protein
VVGTKLGTALAARITLRIRNTGAVSYSRRHDPAGALPIFVSAGKLTSFARYRSGSGSHSLRKTERLCRQVERLSCLAEVNAITGASLD